MSLNKLTNSADYLQKQFLNLGCNDIKCSSIQVSGKDVVTTAGNKNLDQTLTTTQTTFTNDQQLVTKKYVDSGGIVPPNVLTTLGGQNITLTNTTSQTVFTNNQELVTKKYVDDFVSPNVLTTAGGQNTVLTNTTTQTVFTQPQELITKKYVDDQKPTYTNFLKSFTGEFYNDGVVVLEWDGFDEILIRLVTAKSNVYATGLVNYGGSYPSGQHMLLTTVNDDFYQNSSVGQIDFTISCDDDQLFPFYKIRFHISGNNTSYYCYAIVEKFT